MPREKDILDKGDIPPYEEQRPYVKAFREFLFSPKGKRKDRQKWTTPLVNRALWDLWDSPLKADVATFEHFHGRLWQKTRRIIAEGQDSVQHALLFELIKKYLLINKVFIPKLVVNELIELSSNLDLIFPPAHVARDSEFYKKELRGLLKARSEIQSEAPAITPTRIIKDDGTVTVKIKNIGKRRLPLPQVKDNENLDIELKHIPPNALSVYNQYLAIKIDPRLSSGHLAILFAQDYIPTHMGIFLPAFNECYLRRNSSTTYTYYRFNSSNEEKLVEIGLWANPHEIISEDPDFFERIGEIPVYTKSIVRKALVPWERNTDQTLPELAEQFFKKLDE